jgi:hypothetical protein
LSRSFCINSSFSAYSLALQKRKIFLIKHAHYRISGTINEYRYDEYELFPAIHLFYNKKDISDIRNKNSQLPCPQKANFLNLLKIINAFVYPCGRYRYLLVVTTKSLNIGIVCILTCWAFSARPQPSDGARRPASVGC